MCNEKIWDKLYWAMSSRGQTGFALHAIAAIDVAVWDIGAKALGVPLWRLLGGARDKVEV
jgi:L-alanine-DL-glutamate epimerase-like enolase superfamily enzyme